MKIKDVIAQTGLTDRAIRLYIDNELICPEQNETYSGRKSLEFSPADVEQLRHIALLRKAGFTLADIKLLQQGGDPARQALCERIAALKQELALNTRVLEALEQLNTDEAITVEAICQQLDEAVWEKALPAEDTRPSKAELVRKTVFGAIGTVGALISIFFETVLILSYIESFRFIHFYQPESVILTILQNWFVLQFLLSVAILLITFIRPRTRKSKRKRFIVSTTLLSSMSLILALSMLTIPFAGVMSMLTPPAYSLTTNPNDYLVLDNYVRHYADNIYELFPATIPSSADATSYHLLSDTYPETTIYYYKHEEFVDQSFNIYAEWALDDADYKKAKQDAADISYTPTATLQKGDWHCVYYEDTEDTPGIDSSFYFLIFAYNDETQTVRYIIDYCMDAADGYYQPYYYQLAWE